jgi:hypothetical protein
MFFLWFIVRRVGRDKIIVNYYGTAQIRRTFWIGPRCRKWICEWAVYEQHAHTLYFRGDQLMTTPLISIDMCSDDDGELGNTGEGGGGGDQRNGKNAPTLNSQCFGLSMWRNRPAGSQQSTHLIVFSYTVCVARQFMSSDRPQKFLQWTHHPRTRTHIKTNHIQGTPKVLASVGHITRTPWGTQMLII